MKNRKKNIDELCEFRPGDVVVRIDGTTMFTVIGACQTTDWYSLMEKDELGMDKETKIPKRWIDEFYVKVDECGEWKK